MYGPVALLWIFEYLCTMMYDALCVVFEYRLERDSSLIDSFFICIYHSSYVLQLRFTLAYVASHISPTAPIATPLV